MQVMRVSQEVVPHPSRGFTKPSSSRLVTAAPVLFGIRKRGASQNSSSHVRTSEAGNIFGELQDAAS